MLTLIPGCAPNLPWGKVSKMTDEEIQKYNRSFMKEEICSNDKSVGRNIKMQKLIRQQLEMYENILNQYGPRAKARTFYERARQETLTELVKCQIEEFDRG